MNDAPVPAPIRVVICDDHAVFRRGLTIVLGDEQDIEVVGEAGDTEAAVAAVVDLVPDVVLLDLRMPGAGGLQALSRIRQVAAGTKVVILTVSDDDQDLFAAVGAGADGYLLKEVSIEGVGEAVRTVARGERLLSPAMTSKLIDGYADLARSSAGTPLASTAVSGGDPAGASGAPVARPPSRDLSRRELETLAGLARGLSNKAIAHDLGIAENTVKNHVRAVLDKLEVRSRTEAAALAIRERLV